jgi:hypothetical protein
MTQQDLELRAIERVSARASTLTLWIGGLTIAPSVIVAFVLYAALREVSFALIGANFTYLTMAVAICTTVAPAIALARFICRRVVRAKRQAWIEEAAAEHSISASSIAEFFGEWNA